MEKWRTGAFALALLTNAQLVHAEPTIADPAQANAAPAQAGPAPAKAADPDSDDPSKYFYFQKPGVPIEVASADMRECSEYGANIRNIEPGVQNYYVPYTGNLSPAAAGLAGGIGGAIGAMLADALVKAPERRAMRRTVLRKCMSFKGYARYPLSKQRWNEINGGDDRKAAYARMAALAVAPAPAAGALLP